MFAVLQRQTQNSPRMIHTVKKDGLRITNCSRLQRAAALLVVLGILLSPQLAHGITLDEVGQHDTEDDCWSALYEIVYDLTAYAPNHQSGGGPRRVYQLCGTDGTALYDTYHGDNQEWLQEISSIQTVGPLTDTPAATEAPTVAPTDAALPTDPPVAVATTAPTEPPVATSSPTKPPVVITETDPPVVIVETEPPTTDPPAIPTDAPTDDEPSVISLEELGSHNAPGTDCWVAYFDVVYDLSTYMHPDPPGNSVISMSCGEDGTDAFQANHDQSYLSFVTEYIVGDLEVVGETAAPSEFPETTLSPTSDGSSPAGGGDGGGSGDFISLQELQEHADPADCWVSYYGEVYSMEVYAHQHPAGPGIIFASCGWDGTPEYSEYHNQALLGMVQQYYVGTIDPNVVFEETEPDAPPDLRLISREELALHNSNESCWVSYYNDVFDLTGECPFVP